MAAFVVSGLFGGMILGRFLWRGIPTAFIDRNDFEHRLGRCDGGLYTLCIIVVGGWPRLYLCRPWYRLFVAKSAKLCRRLHPQRRDHAVYPFILRGIPGYATFVWGMGWIRLIVLRWPAVQRIT